MDRPWIRRAKTPAASRLFKRTMFAIVLVLLLGDSLRRLAKSTRVLPDARKPIAEALLAEQAESIDWSQYAYCQYVTDPVYLCNSLMIFEALERVGAKASRVMMYPQEWNITRTTRVAKLVRKARDVYHAQLSPIHVQELDSHPTWGESFTKLLAFNQTQYKRVLSLDSDATVLASMDELFLLPSAPVAMPIAYWLNNRLSTQLLLVEPSQYEFQRIQGALANRTSRQFDMEIVNKLYGESSLIIPHRGYNLLSGEFRSSEHHRYLGSKEEAWDPQKVIDEAKYVHFSDWPLPKPWSWRDGGETLARQPACRELETGRDCRDREIWLNLHDDFRERRQRVCQV